VREEDSLAADGEAAAVRVRDILQPARLGGGSVEVFLRRLGHLLPAVLRLALRLLDHPGAPVPRVLIRYERGGGRRQRREAPGRGGETTRTAHAQAPRRRIAAGGTAQKQAQPAREW